MPSRIQQVLVIDDEATHAGAIARQFETCPDIRIEIVGSLRAYRDLIAVRSPDLVLTDLNLPDGRAVDILTSAPGQCAFPIVVMTSNGDERSALEALNAGAVDYVVKSEAALADMPHTVKRAMREWELRQEHKRAKAALRKSEELQRVLFHHSRDALVTLAPPSWSFVSANAAAIALFGATNEADLTSRTPISYSPKRQPDGRSSHEKAMTTIETALREGSHCFEWTHQRLSGDEFPTTVLLTRIELDGSVLLLASIRDESATRRCQALMVQADRLASVSMLATGVAQQINNPLAYLQYNVETLALELPVVLAAAQRCRDAVRRRFEETESSALIQEDGSFLTTDTLKDLVDRARESLDATRRIRQIAQGLGAFSHSDSTQCTAVDLRDPLSAAITRVHGELRHGARIVTDLKHTAVVWAAEGKLSQVFLNLLLNAVHSIDQGDATDHQITIRSWNDETTIVIEVHDTGKGIPPEDLQRVFEPFFTTKTSGVSSGLGLFICRNIVSELGGDLQIRSTLGHGTTCVLRLPFNGGAVPDCSGELSSEIPRDTPKVRGRLLIVDDEEAVRRSMQRLLGQEHDLVCAASGEAAHELLEQDPAFDVIICDLMMPKMSGMALHAWLSSRDPWLARQVVFVTGAAFTPRASEYLASVGNVTLEKPFDTHHLKQVVSVLVHNARRPR